MTQTGNFLALAGLIAVILAQFKITVTTDAIQSVIGGLLTLYGIIHSIIVSNQAQKTIAGLKASGFEYPSQKPRD